MGRGSAWSGLPELLEEEQALALLQETVKLQRPGGPSVPRRPPGSRWAAFLSRKLGLVWVWQWPGQARPLTREHHT